MRILIKVFVLPPKTQISGWETKLSDAKQARVFSNERFLFSWGWGGVVI